MRHALAILAAALLLVGIGLVGAATKAGNTTLLTIGCFVVATEALAALVVIFWPKQTS
jgi:hypothetical protein